MFSLMCARINGRVNNGEAGDLRRHRAHCDVIVIYMLKFGRVSKQQRYLHKQQHWRIYVTKHSKCWLPFTVRMPTQIARFMGPTWDPPGADRETMHYIRFLCRFSHDHRVDWPLQTTYDSLMFSCVIVIISSVVITALLLCTFFFVCAPWFRFRWLLFSPKSDGFIPCLGVKVRDTAFCQRPLCVRAVVPPIYLRMGKPHTKCSPPTSSRYFFHFVPYKLPLQIISHSHKKFVLTNDDHWKQTYGQIIQFDPFIFVAFAVVVVYIPSDCITMTS